MEHSKTPWRIEPATKKDNWRIIAANNQVVSTFSGNMDMDNARRIVACVNTCAGLDTALLENITMLGDTLKDRIDVLRSEANERDKLQQQLTAERASLFAESQRKQQLEQQVEELVGVLERIADTDPEDGTAWFHDIARSAIQKVRGGE